MIRSSQQEPSTLETTVRAAKQATAALSTALGSGEVINPTTAVVQTIPSHGLCLGFAVGVVRDMTHVNAVRRQYQSGKIKKSTLVSYAENGTPFQRKVAAKVFRGDRR